MSYLLNPDIVAENERAPAGLRGSALGVLVHGPGLAQVPGLAHLPGLAHVPGLIKVERD